MSSSCAPSCGLDRLGECFLAALARAECGEKRRLLVSAGGCAAHVGGWIGGTRYKVPLGRSLPFAFGLSAARPDRDVFVLLGDGEAAGVGGHHLLHAARRGDRVRALVVNNEVLEGTGGFPSPTTPRGGRTAASPTGSSPRALDIAELARAAGAAWVGRETLTSGTALERILEEFVAAPPFALLEVRAPCYTAYGQWNGYATPEAMHEALERLALRGSGPASERARTRDGGDSDSGLFRVGRLWPPAESAG